MTLVFSIISLFNINGTKDKDLIIDECYNDFDLVCLQEHCLTDFRINLLRPNPHLDVFFTSPHPFSRLYGGLACVFKHNPNLDPHVTLYPDDFFFAVRMDTKVFINSYLPYDDRSARSMTTLFARCT